MDSQTMIDFLMENDVLLESTLVKGRYMTADATYELSGELVVYETGRQDDIYRGDDLEKAIAVLYGNE